VEVFAQQVVSGMVSGSIYALIALGYVIIYKATDVVNFAQGDFVMMGAYTGIVTYSLLSLPFGVALLAVGGIGILVGLSVGGVMSTMLVRFKASMVNTIIVSLSIGIVLNSSAMLIFGPNPYPMPTTFGKTGSASPGSSRCPGAWAACWAPSAGFCWRPSSSPSRRWASWR
jgi:branched-chain amino acid transport system permease protein